MINKLNSENLIDFKAACKYEHVFGSKIISSYICYGLDKEDATFWVDIKNHQPTTAIYLKDGIALISTNNKNCTNELAQFITEHNIHEVDTNWEQCQELNKILGGTMESSFYMQYDHKEINGSFPLLTDNYNLPEVFSILQQSHEYYRTHYNYDVWAEDLNLRLSKDVCKLYELYVDGKPVGTGMIVSQDDEFGAIAAVAVIPEYRGKKWGTYISSAIVKEILNMGKKPVLISGYDAVAALYQQIGFTKIGRWGELYL